VLFTDSAGCAAVCAALDMDCYATWENIQGACAPDLTRPPLTCDPGSGHQSDYCVCRAPDSTCAPDCAGKACGDDGCGGPCGACDSGTPCVDDQCQCVPKTCESELYHCGQGFDDGCGGTFSCPGDCPPNMPCEAGYCGGPPAPCVPGDCPAFPGAEGEGMYAVGGRGGDVCHVTNLNNSGSGSLRACAQGQSGARTVVFDVAGRIKLKSRLDFTHDKLTVAGQTAPGDGIVISGYDVRFMADDVIVQHLRFRAGDGEAPNCPGGGDGYTEDSLTVNGKRIIVDHVSASWGIDENLSGGNAFEDVTVQYTIISEGLYQTGLWHGECNDLYEPGGDKGHSMGSLFKPSDGDGDMSIHHNLYAHNGNRNPAVGSYDDDQVFRADIRNNVIYNCPSMGYTSGASKQVYVNYVGNYGIFGPSSSSDDLFKGNEDNNLKIYRDDNRLDKDEDDDFDGIDHGSSMWGGEFDTASSPFTFKPVTTHDSEDVPDLVLTWAGARPWSRDEPDERVIEDVYDNTGSLVDSTSEAGGYGDLDPGTPVVDTDGDGMPDDFEAASGTNPNAADHNGDLNGDGYTNLENYLHWAARPR
ncbi:MAG: hypothetical protein QF464_03490, partial [Myxococcota bacterium]|nr:hypothetical protein [Myxococcota bacterium]